MELLLMRHGEAAALGSFGAATDELRDLTAGGAEKIRSAATALNKLDVRVRAVLYSPLLRARRTAEIVTEGLECRPTVCETESLKPGHSIQSVLEELRRNEELGSVGLVGHEPGLSGLADKLLGSRKRPSLIFHTGSVAYLQVELDGKLPAATLHWFLDSRQLDWIARSP